MICRVLQTTDIEIPTLRRLQRDLTWPGSDFHGKIAGWLNGVSATPEDGAIALVEDDGELIGWARTEVWREWHTLEAFVHLGWRRRGVAVFAASGLVAARALQTDSSPAVFAPSMLILAHCVGLRPVLFTREGGEWIQN